MSSDVGEQAQKQEEGAHVAEYPEDPQLRLCVPCGSKTLHDKLKALMLKTTGWYFKQDMIDLAREKEVHPADEYLRVAK